MSYTKKLVLLLGGVVVLVAVVLRIAIVHNEEVATEVARRETITAAAKLDSAVNAAVAAERAAQKLVVKAEAHHNAGKVAASRATARKLSVDSVTIDRKLSVDSDLAEAIAMAEDWHEAYEEEKAASELLRQANDSLRTALATIKPAAIHLSDVSVRLVEVTRPKLFARILPKVGVGVAAGINPATMQPAVVVGVTLGWNR